MNDDTLERRLGALRRTVAPATDLWPGIEKALKVPEERNVAAVRRAPRRSAFPRSAIGWWRRLPAPAWAGLGLAACLAAAAVVFLPRMLAPRSSEGLVELQRELREAEREYRDARERLLGSLHAVTDGYGQETVSRIESDLQALDRLIAEAGKAGGDDHLDWQPVYRLVELYRSQAAGVARADELVRSVSYREEP